MVYDSNNEVFNIYTYNYICIYVLYGGLLKWGYSHWLVYSGKSFSKMDGLGVPP